MSFQDSVDRVWSCIRNDELEKLVVDLVNIPSRTGRERPAAEHLVGFMTNRGLEAELMAMSDERANAIGKNSGRGFGASTDVQRSSGYFIYR